MKFKMSGLLAYLKENGVPVNRAKVENDTLLTIPYNAVMNHIGLLEFEVTEFMKSNGYKSAKPSYSGVVLGSGELLKIVINSGSRVNLMYINLKQEKTKDYKTIKGATIANKIYNSEGSAEQREARKKIIKSVSEFTVVYTGGGLTRAIGKDKDGKTVTIEFTKKGSDYRVTSTKQGKSTFSGGAVGLSSFACPKDEDDKEILNSEHGKKPVEIYYTDLTEKKQKEISKSGLDVNKAFPMVVGSSGHGTIIQSEDETPQVSQVEVSEEEKQKMNKVKFLVAFKALISSPANNELNHVSWKNLLSDLTTEELQAYYALSCDLQDIENANYRIQRASKELLENRMLLGSKFSDGGSYFDNSTHKYMDKAETLIKQLGGVNKLSAMLGANTFIALDNGVSFKFKNFSKANYVKITVNKNDLYELDFKKLRGLNSKDVKVFKDVHVSDLKKEFTKFTGLDLSLGQFSEHGTKKVSLVNLLKKYFGKNVDTYLTNQGKLVLDLMYFGSFHKGLKLRAFKTELESLAKGATIENKTKYSEIVIAGSRGGGSRNIKVSLKADGTLVIKKK